MKKVFIKSEIKSEINMNSEIVENEIFDVISDLKAGFYGLNEFHDFKRFNETDESDESDETDENFNYIKSSYIKTISVFGSARFDSEHPDYVLAQQIAHHFSEIGCHIMTGGGPGIMEASNKGAQQKKLKRSIGINIKLPHEQKANEYQDISIECKYFFTRKYFLIYYSDAFIFMPGGFGTLDEIAEVLTLIQTNKISHKPCVFVNSSFWKPLLDWFQSSLVSYQTIKKEDIYIYDVANTLEEVINIFDKHQ